MAQYIGARYVPKFMGAYDNTQAYEALCVVDNSLGTSYISKVPTPAGTPLTNTTYWAVYGASSGAIINLQNQIDALRDSTVQYFESVTDMLATDLQIGEVVATLGYYNAYDGGGAIYNIVASTAKLHETLSNGNVAEMVYTDTVSVLQVGAVGDGITDDLAAFQNVVGAVQNVIVPAGHTYELSDSLTLPAHCNLSGTLTL